MSEPPYIFAPMVKFDPEGFDAMMSRMAVEEREKERQAAMLRSPFDDLEPEWEYMPASLNGSYLGG